MHLLTTNTTDTLRLAQFIQAQEAAVGINVVIDSTDSATARRAADERQLRRVRSAASSRAAPTPTPTSTGSSRPRASRNYSGYSNPRLDLILANGLKATSSKARATLYRVAQQIIHDDRPIIVLYNPITFAAFSTNLTGVQLTSNGALIVANARFR